MRQNQSMPSSPIIPELGCRDVRAANEWLIGAFGFTTRLIIGDHRIQMAMRYGDASGDLVLVGIADPTPSVASVIVRVEDVDSYCERARRHGADVLGEPTDYPYGERQYNVLGPGEAPMDVLADPRRRRPSQLGRTDSR